MSLEIIEKEEHPTLMFDLDSKKWETFTFFTIKQGLLEIRLSPDEFHRLLKTTLDKELAKTYLERREQE